MSPSMIQADKGKYHRLGAPCTRPHKSWTGGGLPPQVCPCDGIVSPRGHRALAGVSDLLMLRTTTSFDGVETFPSTKEPYRLVHWAHQERPWRKIRAPLSQNTTRDSPARYAYTVTSGQGRADSCASPVPGSSGGCHVAISRASTGSLAATHTQIYLCAPVLAGGGSDRDFGLTAPRIRSVFV